MRYLLLILVAINIFANDDLDLVKMAYNNGLEPVPRTFESLLAVIGADSKELTKQKIALGKKLFFEKKLSLHKDINCASCHSFDKGGADERSTAIGHMDRENPFHLNTPTVLNTAFSKKFFWNGRSETLEDQAKGPLQAPFEMSITPDLAEQRIQDILEYQILFTKIYGDEGITFENIADAISAYEKTIITHGKYDDFLLGDFDALTKEEKEGMKLFITKSCVGCHNGIGLGGQVLRQFPLLTHTIWSLSKPKYIKSLQDKYEMFLQTIQDQKLKNDTTKKEYLKRYFSKKDTKLLEKGFFDQIDPQKVSKVMTTTGCNSCHLGESYKITKELIKDIAFPFKNKGGFLGKSSTRYFRVPLLRNIVRTAPYFHNGEVEKLEDAIKIMGRHQSRANLSDTEIKKIIAFLKAVDGELVKYKITAM
jgi:cytochrome c peroxidase